MSIHQPIQLPVSVFSSSDTDAPQLTPAGAAGEIKTILKACLITGYGQTPGQGGWEMPFEDGNKAVFRSADPRATGFCLRIDHNYPKYGDIACYRAMTDIDTGVDEWLNDQVGFIYSNANAVSWHLLATSAGFVLIVEHDIDNAMALTFGDLMPTLDNDNGNCHVSFAKKYSNAAYFGYIPFSNSSWNRLLCASDNASLNKTTELKSLGSIVAKDYTQSYNGHIAVRDYFFCDNVFRFLPFWQVSNKNEAFPSKVEIINGREYFVTSLSRSGYVYFFPTDYWQL